MSKTGGGGGGGQGHFCTMSKSKLLFFRMSSLSYSSTKVMYFLAKYDLQAIMLNVFFLFSGVGQEGAQGGRGRHIYLTKSLHSSSMKVTQRGNTSYITYTDIATYRLNWHRDRFSDSFTWKNKFAIHMNFKRHRY